MEYYCIMITTGEESSFKKRALDKLQGTYPELQIYNFERNMYTEKRGWFKKPLFPGYLFVGVNKFSPVFLKDIKSIKGFHYFLRDNKEPIKLTGAALEELSFLIRTGEVLGVSKVQFLPDQKIKAISGPFVGYEGKIVAVNRKKKRITVRSSLMENSTTFDLKFEEAEVSSC